MEAEKGIGVPCFVIHEYCQMRPCYARHFLKLMLD